MKGRKLVIEERKPIRSSPPTIQPNGIALIGEAGGEKEEFAGRPFVGPAGRKLDELLEAAGIDRRACFVSNVINATPPKNDFSWFFTRKKAEASADAPHMKGCGWLREPFIGEFDRLHRELEEHNIRVVVALGNKPMQMLTGETKITKTRGTILEVPDAPYVVVPTYHPSYVMRTGGWSDKVVQDLELAAQIAVGGDEEYNIKRTVYVAETLQDIVWFHENYLKDAPAFAFDIETEYKTVGQIDCIGFAPNPHVALVIPIINRDKKDWNYWSEADEIWVRKWIRDQLAREDVRKIGQNVLYDIEYLAREGTRTLGRWDDTMMAAYVLDPEDSRDLAALAVKYSKERVAWKTLADFSGDDKENA